MWSNTSDIRTLLAQLRQERCCHWPTPGGTTNIQHMLCLKHRQRPEHSIRKYNQFYYEVNNFVNNGLRVMEHCWLLEGKTKQQIQQQIKLCSWRNDSLDISGDRTFKSSHQTFSARKQEQYATRKWCYLLTSKPQHAACSSAMIKKVSSTTKYIVSNSLTLIKLLTIQKRLSKH